MPAARFALALAAVAYAQKQKGCTAVPEAKCGMDFWNSCLKCGDKSEWDCEACCHGCTLSSKKGYSYCMCSGPRPDPPGNDTWSHYTVAGMEVAAVTGGKHQAYDKVVVMLHGGGGSNQEWIENYQSGWFGDVSGLKLVFPSRGTWTTRSGEQESGTWYASYKLPNCGLADDCAYDMDSIRLSASKVGELLAHERALVGGDASKVFLAGFSEGAQMTGYVQLAQLDYALGGTIVMDGFPLPPLFDWPHGHANATYHGSDMRWVLWHGEADEIFPVDLTLNTWDSIFDTLGAKSTVKVEHREPGMVHMVIQKELQQVLAFVRGGAADEVVV
jgi:predicted esterase